MEPPLYYKRTKMSILPAMTTTFLLLALLPICELPLDHP